MNITINLIGWKRPYYFKEVVEALGKCYNIQNYKILVSIDGGKPQKQKRHEQIFENSVLSKLDHQIFLHEENLGCAGNSGFAFNKAFEDGCDAVIVLEDDTVPSIDYLIFMEHCLKKFENDKRIFSVTGYMPRFQSRYDNEGIKNIIYKNRDFGCYGWGTWRRIYEEIGNEWFGIKWRFGYREEDGFSEKRKQNLRGKKFLHTIQKTPHGSWGYAMNKYWRKGRFQVFPDVSRIQNIGVEESTFRKCSKAEQTVHYWAENHSDKEIYTDFEMMD